LTRLLDGETVIFSSSLQSDRVLVGERGLLTAVTVASG
jgi:hypothetical protein